MDGAGGPRPPNPSTGAAPTKEKEEEIVKKYTLEKEHELRFEVDYGVTATLTVTSGTAEVFGTEMANDRKYTFTGTKSAVFTWYGCTLEMTGKFHAYIANETPMMSYLNVHLALEEKRTEALNRLSRGPDAKGKGGPRVMLVGPVDTGKTSISKILLTFAARFGHTPIFVDLDVGQGSITVPATISAVRVDRPLDIEEGFASSPPDAYFFGHASPQDNPKHYKMIISKIAQDIERACSWKKEVNASGVIINTCGWIDGLGFELILFAMVALKVDVVLVIDNERLYADLSVGVGEGIEVVKLSKSGGVVTRPPQFRRKTRMQAIRTYFYGPTADLCPLSTVLDFRSVVIYRIGSGPLAPLSALPIGAESSIDPVKLTEQTPSLDMLHSILAVSYATSPEKVVDSNVAGFLYVTEVNLERNKFTVLAPCPGALPSKYLIIGTLKWIE